ncbi:MAG: hypothetical protein RIA63_09610, partial [Cyclobacteriaceae bacterium]
MDNLDSWYSFSWFYPSTFSDFTWASPLFLWLIAIVPLIFILRWTLRYLFNQKLPVALVKSDLKNTPLTLIRLLPDIILILVLSLLLVALGRPQKTNEKVEQWTEGID